METNEEHEDLQKNALMLLQDLEFISRRLCEGYAIEPSHAEKVMDLLANFFELIKVRNNLEGVISYMESSGVNGRSEGLRASMAPMCSHRLKWFRQTSEALTRIKIENEDLDHRVSFVNAAIECMNLLCSLFSSPLPRFNAGYHRLKTLRSLADSQRVY
jgi:hypothetical protein